MTNNELNELRRIVERYLPIGNEKSLCHVGIRSMKRCSRCVDALKVRELINLVWTQEVISNKNFT